MLTGRFSAQLRLRRSASVNPTLFIVAICRSSSHFIAFWVSKHWGAYTRHLVQTEFYLSPPRFHPRFLLHHFPFMASVQPSTIRTAAHRRKFSLVKCERCRLDKQKCLPTKREWPARCDRCAEKDFSCSPGRRIQRKSKHNVES